MFRKASSLTLELRELPYGSVWLVGDGDGNPSHLSPLAMHALSTADAVIHDLGVSQKFLDLVKSSHYRETGAPRRAIGRAIQLAQDGWRVVHLVEGKTIERAIECATRCAEHDVPFCIVPDAGEPIGRKALLGLLLLRKSASLGRADPGSSLVLVVPHSAGGNSAGERAKAIANWIFNVGPRRLAGLHGRRSHSPAIGAHHQGHSRVLIISIRQR